MFHALGTQLCWPGSISRFPKLGEASPGPSAWNLQEAFNPKIYSAVKLLWGKAIPGNVLENQKVAEGFLGMSWKTKKWLRGSWGCPEPAVATGVAVTGCHGGLRMLHSK